MKPKVAFFDFASCEGCQLQIANLEEDILDLINIVEVVSFREVMKEHSDDYDIAFIEGSIQRPIDEERIKKIRETAKLVVALGTCAHLGGVQKLANQWTPGEALKEVYKDFNTEGNEYFNSYGCKAINEVIKVDAFIPGCPINRDEFKRVVTDLLVGKAPVLPSYPVCVECKKKENVCVFDLGGFCLGPVTRAGCDAICPTFKDGCEGCRGFLEDAKMNAEKSVLEKHGVTVDDMLGKLNMFNYKKEGQ